MYILYPVFKGNNKTLSKFDMLEQKRESKVRVE